LGEPARVNPRRKPMSKPFRASEKDWQRLKDLVADPDVYGARAILELRSRIEVLEAAQPAPDQQAAAAEPGPRPEADQPAADSPFKPGQIWWMRSRRVVKITSVENYHEGDFCITFADYPFAEATLFLCYRSNGEALLDTNNRNYDLIKLFSGPK
jgi:hypothetical protein